METSVLQRTSQILLVYLVFPEVLSEFPDPSPTALTLTKQEKSKGGRYSCFETPFDEGKSAFCSTLYISKQRKFVPLFDYGGTFLICACVKEISPETLRSVVF